MRIAYFDPFSGASGDMILGALLDAGLSEATLRSDLGKIELPGYSMTVGRDERGSVSGVRVVVRPDDEQPHRHWTDIRALIEDSALDAPVKDAALAIFSHLAEAEAGVHGTTPEQVHFHEVGGVDAIVDICGACIGLARLRVEAVFSGPPRLGSGFVRAAHGLLPVPAPATASLLARANAPVAAPDPGNETVEAELLTPTGAAILTTLAEFRRPDFVPSAIGYGLGTRVLPWPNALRVWIGETADTDDARDDGDILIETNIDDMNPQFFDLLSERLFAAGALDVWLTAISMKKGRPATQLSVIAPRRLRHAIDDALIANSTTLGVRSHSIERVKAARKTETVVTRWGEVRVKLRGWNGRVLDARPEYDDCAAIARTRDIPVREVWAEASRLGEVYVGGRMA